ncbi:MAG: LysR family transcriptional regulator [Pseudomonadota bacterium]
MNKNNYLRLDGQSLTVFLAVLEERSVSRAADRLALTQSAVSHTLARLRQVLDDPLFVRSGRSISPTAHAKALRTPVRHVLDELKQMGQKQTFLPAGSEHAFTIAANDFQRDLIFPRARQLMLDAGADIRFRFISSGVPDASLLREARCDLVVTPFPPEGPDIYQVLLFKDRLVCFFDGAVRSAPTSKAAYRDCEHIEVRFEENRSTGVALSGHEISMSRPPSVSVPNFGALRPFMLGTRLISTEARLMSLGPLAGMDFAPLPFRTSPLPMYLAWHQRDHADPAHIWLRKKIRAATEQVLPKDQDPA